MAKNCFDPVRAALGDWATDDDVRSILKTAARLKAEHAKPGAQATPTMRGVEGIVDSWAKTIEMNEVMAARARFLDLKTTASRRARLDTFDRPDLGITSVTVGTNQLTTGAAASVDSRAVGLQRRHAGKFLRAIEADPDVKAAWHSMPNDRDLERRVIAEMHELRDGGNPGVSGDPIAQKMAKVIADTSEELRKLQNAHGAFIGKIPGYITRQSWDQMKIQKASLDKFLDDFMPRMDWERAFDGELRDATDDERRAALASVKTALGSGVHLKPDMAPDRGAGMTGPSNLAKKISQDRVLHFKDNEWSALNDLYGQDTFQGSILRGIESASRNIALMQVYGTNPAAAFESDLRYLKEKHRDNPDKINRLNQNEWILRNHFASIDGSQNIAGNTNLGHYGASARGLQTLAKLGSVPLTQIADSVPFGYGNRRLGRSFLGGIVEQIASQFEGRSKSERRAIALATGAGLEGELAYSLSRFMTVENGHDFIAKSVAQMFKWSGSNYMTDMGKRRFAVTVTNWAAQHQHLAMDILPPDFARELRNSGIGPKEWDAIRAGQAGDPGDGRMYLTGDAIDQLPDGVIQAYIGKPKSSQAEITRARSELAGRYAGFIAHQVDSAIITPGARERSWIYQGTRPGTVSGEAFRFAMQFKAFPAAFANRVLGRALFNGDKADIAGLAAVFVWATAMGFAVMVLKDISKGIAPRDIATMIQNGDGEKISATLMAAALQGGGLGILGDFLFGDFSRFGGSLAETLAGPTVGTIGGVAKIFSKARGFAIDRLIGDETEKASDVGTGIYQFMQSNNPVWLANLWYTKLAIKTLIHGQMAEALNPGVLGRYERRLKRETGQEFFAPPSQIIPYGGGMWQMP